MGLTKRGNVWWIRMQRNGRLVQQSTGTSNKKLAESRHAKVLQELDAGTWHEPPKENHEPIEHTFEELKERYMADHSLPNKAPGSSERDYYSFKQLGKAFGGLKLERDYSERDFQVQGKEKERRD